MAPVITLLITVDFEKNIINAEGVLQSIGYLFRALVLFSIGGFIAWLHDSEDKIYKVFEIGLGAPALIAGMITTTSLSPNQAETTTPPNAITFSIISSSHAQTPLDPKATASQTPPFGATASAPQQIKEFSPPQTTKSSQFFEGFLGIRQDRPTNIYYVIVASTKSREDALKQASDINNKYQDIHAEVYAPYADSPYYGVVIGASLNRAEANALKLKAVEAGLAKDTYIWTYPSLRR